MARKRTPNLTEAELRLMTVIWELGEATVNDVMQALPDDVGLAYNTVLTTMRILERKGYLNHEKHGRAHTYCPTISRIQAQSKAVRHMVQSLFNDSPQLLLLSVLESEELSPDELERLQQMLKAKE